MAAIREAEPARLRFRLRGLDSEDARDGLLLQPLARVALVRPGAGGQFGPEIQFDTKGVEFGPWIRRFIAQVKRNWLIPYAAMSMKGHVVWSSLS